MLFLGVVLVGELFCNARLIRMDVKSRALLHTCCSLVDARLIDVWLTGTARKRRKLYLLVAETMWWGEQRKLIEYRDV